MPRSVTSGRPTAAPFENKMKIWVIAAAIVILALVAAGVRVADEAALRTRFLKSLPDSVPTDSELASYAQSRGEPAYRDHCATCHGTQLQGDRVRNIPNLADGEWLFGSGRVTEIERIVLYGIRSGNSKGLDLADMPAYARHEPYRRYKIATLLPREIDDVVAYLLSFQKPPTDTAAVERGARLFSGSEKGVCWDCHGEDAEGDTAIGAPNLTDNVWLSGDGSRQSIHDAIAFGLAGNCPAWIARLPPATIRAVAVYVHSHQLQGGDKR
jgi:cytochrome c oxidase cbb3-type subunit III